MRRRKDRTEEEGKEDRESKPKRVGKRSDQTNVAGTTMGCSFTRGATLPQPVMEVTSSGQSLAELAGASNEELGPPTFSL